MNNLTVIGFFPGAGGNRFLLSLLGKEFETLNTTYDLAFKNQLTPFRYLLDTNLTADSDYCLTHCMNVAHIKKVLSPAKIIFIDSDLKQCMRRQWVHDGMRLYNVKFSPIAPNELILRTYNGIKDATWPVISSIEEFNQVDESIRTETLEATQKTTGTSDKVDSAWTSIKYHCSYYNDYPIDYGDCQVESISSETRFAQVMREELALYNSELFDFCWDVYWSEGPNAPIIDLYNQRMLGLK